MNTFLKTLFSYPTMSIKLWAMILSEIPTLTALFLIGYALAYWDWHGHEPQRIWYLGTGFLLLIGGRLVVIAALAAVGIKATGPGGISVDIDPEDIPPTVVTTTTKTEVSSSDGSPISS